MSDNQPVTVHVLDKEYRVACKPGERDELLESARYLDAKMREIRNNGRVLSADKVALMAASNISHQLKNAKSDGVESISRRIRNLQDKIDLALNSNKQLEL